MPSVLRITVSQPIGRKRNGPLAHNFLGIEKFKNRHGSRINGSSPLRASIARRHFTWAAWPPHYDPPHHTHPQMVFTHDYMVDPLAEFLRWWETYEGVLGRNET